DLQRVEPRLHHVCRDDRHGGRRLERDGRRRGPAGPRQPLSASLYRADPSAHPERAATVRGPFSCAHAALSSSRSRRRAYSSRASHPPRTTRTTAMKTSTLRIAFATLLLAA